MNLTLSNCLKRFKHTWLGDSDLADVGGDRLGDSLNAWGGANAIRKLVAAHYDAAATQVSATLTRAEVSPSERAVPNEAVLGALSPR